MVPDRDQAVPLHPVSPSDRIVEIDIVRGFALFGVLLVNMYGYGADSIAWNGTLDRTLLAIVHLLFDSKFWTLFSLLFGLGLAIQIQRLAVSPVFARTMVLLRRFAFLFVLGMGHALFYEGDILMLYAEAGFLLLLIHRLPGRLLFILALCLLMVFPVAHWLQPDRDADPAPSSVAMARQELLTEQESSIYATGTVWEVFEYNADIIPENLLADYQWPDSGLAVVALLIFGLLLGRSGILRNIPVNTVRIRRARKAGIYAGVLAMGLEYALSDVTGYDIYYPGGSNGAIQFTGDFLFVTGAVSLAVGYAATLILFARQPLGRSLLKPLRYAGRMALTVYLTQALVFTTLFHGYGFGMAYRMGPLDVTLTAIVIFVVQTLLSYWWLRYFRFGPFEWLWRSFTYLQWQRLKHENGSSKRRLR